MTQVRELKARTLKHLLVPGILTQTACFDQTRSCVTSAKYAFRTHIFYLDCIEGSQKAQQRLFFTCRICMPHIGHHTPPLRPNLSRSSSTRSSPDMPAGTGVVGGNGRYAPLPRCSPASSGGGSHSSFDAYDVTHPVDQLHAPPSAPLAPPPFPLQIPNTGNA